MSTSIYLVSGDEITTEDALTFLADVHALNIEKDKVAGLVAEGGANVWINFLGSSVLKESDEDELEAWSECLGRKPCSVFELTVGKGEGSMGLAVKIARKSMRRWSVVVDDLYDSVYSAENLDEILTP